MSDTLNRRTLMLAGAVTLVTPALAQAKASASVADYLERLRGRIGDAGGGRFIPSGEDLLLEEHNSFRTRQGLGRLSRHAALDQAARAHAADMIERGYFEHASPEGFSSVERVGLLARRFVGLAGENIVEVRGGPAPTAAELTQLWRDSPGHRANMLRPGYTHIGFGIARKGDRTVAAAAFGESFAELPAPLAFQIGGLETVGQLLGDDSRVRGFSLAPVGGGRQIGPFWAGDPMPKTDATGAFAVKPYLADTVVQGRYIVVDGPIVDAVSDA